MPPGKLPSDVGCVVMNVASIAFIGRYVAMGKPLVSRSMTVDGSAIKTPKNVRVPIGTMMDYIVDYCGGFTEEPEKIVCGGPMMGAAITDINYPILKGNNALLAFKKGDLSIKKETDCIRCGRCAAACPLNLVPTNIEKFTKIGDIPKLKHSGAMVCMECGSCAYSCPAGKPLVQHMRLAKATIREKEAKK
jgi:electron transport complex protein RnfC